ncbi:Hypotetical predicted protein [Rhizobium favelukesii]|uniref:SnoaL-like domain-containing protein n=1 Tax=Rhizobium favelukesii TaxID=348824 RepID=W6R412_9HYPH|nr:Hypotetical predicted protein [Rhizobium favelukesii]
MLVLEAFDTLFSKRDYEAAEAFWSDHYIQHSAHIEPGRDGLSTLSAVHPSRSATSTARSWPKAISSSCTGVSRATAGRPPGSRPMWSGPRMVNSPSIGTCCRTKQRKPNPRAVCLCSATVSRPNRRPDPAAWAKPTRPFQKP